MPKYLKLQVKLATMLVCIYNELLVVRRVCLVELTISHLISHLFNNSHFCLACNSYDFRLENLVLDQLIIPHLKFNSILITCLLGKILIL